MAYKYSYPTYNPIYNYPHEPPSTEEGAFLALSGSGNLLTSGYEGASEGFNTDSLGFRVWGLGFRVCG